ncbi:MAG TPA: lipoprotein [Chlamydiales bacterium]|nr:lipoprotein [Chlamydiales bacterium]
MKKMFFALGIASLLSSCSVVMASKIEGVDMDTVQSIRSRSQLIAIGAQPVISDRNEEGQLVETYRILEQKGSVARAFMHGLLDISTAFLWEIAGTPIESSLGQSKYFSLKVTFDEEEQIKKMELF